MEYKIVASDLDGTLLDENSGISAENWQAIQQLHARGVHFVPASGRAYAEMPVQLRESPLIRYYITSDGTTVYDKYTDTTREIPLSRELGWQVLDRLFRYPILLMVHADTNSYVDKRTHNAEDYARYHMNDYWIKFALEKEVTVPDIRHHAYALERIQSLIAFFLHKEDLLVCKEFFERDPRLIVAQSDEHNLEIFSAEAGKGNALLLLADLLSVDRSATIAVGDTTNDYTMVKAAGLGLAMENAVPELKEVADAIICHHRDHGARYILEHYFAE